MWTSRIAISSAAIPAPSATNEDASAIASGARFLMSAANHPMLGFTTFPFFIFGGDWHEQTADLLLQIPSLGNSVIGNDVWIGRDAMLMPAVSVGDGRSSAQAPSLHLTSNHTGSWSATRHC